MDSEGYGASWSGWNGSTATLDLRYNPGLNDSMPLTGRIGNRDVPYLPGPLITVIFSAGGGGPSEAGTWQFWSVFRTIDGREVPLTARCRQTAEPAERFRRLQADSDQRYFQFASLAEGIRPATMLETVDWLYGHQTDTPHVQSLGIFQFTPSAD